jgi:hypothetical protein
LSRRTRRIVGVFACSDVGEAFAKAKDMKSTTQNTSEWHPTFARADYARPEFSGAADSLVATYSEFAERMRIEPYPVNVLEQEKRRGFGRRGGLAAELRTLDAYLEEIRRAAG